jgi:hypothetical protein
MANTTKHPSRGTAYTRGRGDARHSHFEYGSTKGHWGKPDDTDFVITSVNVPDRLDTQEVRNRAEADSSLPTVRRFHRDDVMRAVRWGVALVLLVAVGWWGMRVAAPLRAAISPAGVEARLGAALGLPVSVADTALRFSPSPRLLVTDVFVQSGFRLPEVAVLFNWSDAFRGLQTGHWVFGEARVAPFELTGEQALALLNSIRGASRLPAALSTIRFESISFSDLALLPGRYGTVIRRGVGQQDFAALAMKRLDAEGRVDLEITPALAPGGNASFALFANKWPGAVGPAVVWDEATAQGEFRGDLLKIDSFSVGARFGNVNGAASLAKAGEGWRISGSARSPDLNVGELIRYAAGLNEADSRVPLQGVAKLDLALSGSGATAAEALLRASASGTGSMPGATFSGLNLGLAATQGGPASAGGVTRLTDLEFEATLSRGGLIVRNLGGRAGGMRMTGGFSVDPSLQLNGLLRPEVAAPRGTASAMIQVGGTIAAPTYR